MSQTIQSTGCFGCQVNPSAIRCWTTSLIETWLGEGLCREAVVNLKLPMKQRYAEVRRLLDRMEATFKVRKIRVSIACKQLYHDREEVTCHLRRLDLKPR